MRTLLLAVTFLALAPAPPQEHASGASGDRHRVEVERLGVRKAETPHVIVTTSSSDDTAAPGARISLYLDVAPKPKMHVYAPEQKELIPISLSLDPDPSFKSDPPKFPRAEAYFFEPLSETQQVYSSPFRIVQDVTVARTPAMRGRAGKEGAALTISGALRYQACDDKVCYLPQSVPVAWTISLKAR